MGVPVAACEETAPFAGSKATCANYAQVPSGKFRHPKGGSSVKPTRSRED